MAKTTKLKNVEAINKMLVGEHRTQTRTTILRPEPTNVSNIRNVGDIWEETDIFGNTHVYEQKNGYRVKKAKNSDIIKAAIDVYYYPNCYEDCNKKLHNDFGHGDAIMNKKTGRCIDCQVIFESKLKYAGEFNDYAKDTMKANALAFFKDADIEVEALIESVKNMQFANENGTAEVWSIQDAESYSKYIKEQYDKYKQMMMDNFI